ncbi:MAG: matrixin family metalloprotease [Nitrososphaeraceae archaeon]
MKTINNFIEIIIVRYSQASKYSTSDNPKNVLTYAFFVILVTIVILLSIDNLDTKQANAAEKIDVCCFWNEKLDDGILTVSIDSKNKIFRTLVVAALYEWQKKMDNIISFAVVKMKSEDKYGDLADIRFTPEKSHKNMIKISEKMDSDYNYAKEKIDSGLDDLYIMAHTIIKYTLDGKYQVIHNIDITVWSATYTPELMKQYGFGKYTAYNAILHEIGHALGLDHSDNIQGLLSPFVEVYGVDERQLQVSNCDAYTALDQNGMLYYYTKEEFPTYAEFVGLTGDDQESQGYYECTN